MTDSGPLRVIGDIHGEAGMFRRAIDGAGRIILLGDLIDRGPDSPGVLRLAIELVRSGQARLVRSNHDDKLFRWLMGRPVKMGPQLTRTLDALRAAPDYQQLVTDFVAIFEAAPFVLSDGDYIFAHGAIDPRRFSDESPWQDGSRQHDAMALYGEVNGDVYPDGKPIRRYAWVDSIPQECTAIVGHDRRGGTWPLIHQGALGGRAIFLDTGAGKGGPLSYMDLPAETIGQAHPG
jgi:hypothetical protein